MTIKDNVLRILKHYNLDDSIVITRIDEDRVWAWPVDNKLFTLFVMNFWERDIKAAADVFHGTAISYREPGGKRPALQVCVHPLSGANKPVREGQGESEQYFLEIDIDEAAPDIKHPLALMHHVFEVARNAITKRKTNQQRISEMLDKRFGKEKA